MQTTPRPFGILLLAMSGALLVNSVLGPLGLDAIDYDVSESLRNQLVGLEVVTVVLVVPWSAVAGIRALRGRPDAPLLAFGPAAYTLYMFVQYVLGPEYADYRPAQLLHLGLVVLSGGLTLWAWSLSRATVLPERSRRAERGYAAVLAGLALFVVLRYAGGLLASFGSAPIPDEFAAGRTFYWSIHLLDLAFVVPATLVSAVALARGRPLGHRGLYAVTGWFALVPPSVAAMAAVMLVNDDPNGSLGTTVLLTTAALAFAGFAAHVHRPLVRGPVRGGTGAPAGAPAEASVPWSPDPPGSGRGHASPGTQSGSAKMSPSRNAKSSSPR